ALAPGAVRLLHLLEPGDGPADHRMAAVEADRLQADEHLPGAVDVVDAPPPDPAAAAVLGLLQEREGAIDLRLAGPIAVLPERLQHAARDVRAARVEHG